MARFQNRSAWMTLLGLCALSPGPGHAALTDLPIDDPEVKGCLSRAMPEKSMSQKVTFQLFNGTDLVSTSSAELFWKRDDSGRSRALIRMTAPQDRAGLAVLATEREGTDPDLMVYLPETGKARRVAGKTIDASMFGTDFSYEDFAYFQGVATGSKTTRLEDQAVEGATNYVLETVPTTDGSKYSRVVSYINKEQCMVSKIEFFAKNGTLLKELIVPHDSVKQEGTRWIPYKVTLNDMKHNSRTELAVDELKIDPELSETMFSATRFGAGH
jgi:hypothetical protein